MGTDRYSVYIRRFELRCRGGYLPMGENRIKDKGVGSG